jgi:REP element-mobilizing transposase RayT
MARRRRRWKQLELRPRTWGGARDGSGRKKSDRAGVPHRPRSPIRKKTVVHVTVRLVREIRSLRRFKLAPAMRTAFVRTAKKDDFRLCQFSIQRDHLHLACEADSKEGLARGVQGVEISFAKRLNAALGRKGKVFADRFHAVVVKSPRQLRNTLCYIMNNARRHGEPLDPTYNGIDPFSSAWYFEGWSDDRWREGLGPPRGEDPCVAPAESWLMSEGWRKHGPIGVTEVPKAARKLHPTREEWLGMVE